MEGRKMKRETKVGLAVAATFVCLVGGVFATKYLHGPKSDATPPVAQSGAPEKAAGEARQQSPPANPGDVPPLYTPPPAKGGPPALDLEPVPNQNPRRPAAPPPDLDLPLGPPGGAAPAKPAKTPPPLDDPSKDDVFNPATVPSRPAKPMKPADDGGLALMPVPNGPAQPKKPAAPPPDLDLLDPPAAPKDNKNPPKMLPPGVGVTRIANPPADIPGLDLDTPGEKKPVEKK